MRSSRRLMALMFGLAVIPGLVGLSPGALAVSRASATAAVNAKTSVQPTDLASISEVSHTGRYLKAAGMQLEDAFRWAGGRIDEKSKEAIQKAKDVGERMEKGVAGAWSDVVKYFEEANKEMNDAAQRMQSLR